MSQPLALTELVLRDAHQSLLATRLRLEDMLPIASALDKVGYWSVESWGGATFDACIRYLGEDPWDRIRQLKAAMPNTKQQMLLRGQNLLGYRHYADDVVQKFVERAHVNGVDVFRIFDAMNDVRNLKTAVAATVKCGAHAQGTLSYTVSPVHNLQTWLDMAKKIEDLGVHSICIKDMAGLLNPYECENLILGLKKVVNVPIALHCHATTGLSTATYQKAIDAGIDILDTAISPMSMTYGHTATETIVSILENTVRNTGISLKELEPIASYFRAVRKKYEQFEGSLTGVDARILLAQVPGGMLTNMESQLKEQGAEDKFEDVLKEIPRVREDLGFIPLVTPTSQIVGTQSVLNVLTGERYKSISKETVGVLKGEYGKTPAPVNAELQNRVLDGTAPITCRPADKLTDEFEKLTDDLQQLSKQQGFTLADVIVDDVLTYALFPQIGLKFLKNRGNPDAFEVKPKTHFLSQHSDEIPQGKQTTSVQTNVAQAHKDVGHYDVTVDGQAYQVSIGPSGSLSHIESKIASNTQTNGTTDNNAVSKSTPVNAPLTGNVIKVVVSREQLINEGDVIVILEAMKMETEIRSSVAGTVDEIFAKEGDAIQAGQPLLTVG